MKFCQFPSLSQIIPQIGVCTKRPKQRKKTRFLNILKKIRNFSVKIPQSQFSVFGPVEHITRKLLKCVYYFRVR